ncbi:uncharacterized protein LOC111790822 isoform X2 [Cucurbita pepo subsp. pepo]|uniref:uncharacterized protein LOC111790822 isoform X2 n=1 Tax=Cucurbita pepo subsp. pepo TaxID=3664 RepID=UPI000C9D61B2|nr:uncharacterized protein LOC111790822 isoform X2 [Cucurbita pepo subsp. pepo]
MEDLSEEERRALRGSKFAPLPSQPTSSSRSHPRLAHPGGPLKTNKAAALAKFLDRKLHQDPNGLSSINPQILELAVRNAKASVLSSSGTNIRHVDTFDDPEVFPFRIPCPFYRSRTTNLTDDDDVGLF